MLTSRLNARYIVVMNAKTRITPNDWHPADVVAALRKAGWSLRKLSQHHGYGPTALGNALYRRWPKAQRLIAEAIGISPEVIWPSRYHGKTS